MQLVGEADVFIVIGTSLQVYPAASLIHYAKADCKVYLLDPNASNISVSSRVTLVAQNASVGVPFLVNLLTE